MSFYRKLKDLRKLEGNPRVIKDKDFERLCESIRSNQDYFQARPLILSNRTGALVIIAGNQRYEAAKHIGLKEVPTFLIEGLTEEREREIIIRDNVSNGEWDFDILSNAWNADELETWGVDIPIIADPAEEETTSSGESYRIEVTCEDPEEQEVVYNKLIELGLDVRML